MQNEPSLPHPRELSKEELLEIVYDLVGIPLRDVLISAFGAHTHGTYYVLEDTLSNAPRFRIFAAAKDDGGEALPVSMELMVAKNLNALRLYPHPIDKLDHIRHEWSKCSHHTCFEAQLFLQNAPGAEPELSITAQFSALDRVGKTACQIINSLTLASQTVGT